MANPYRLEEREDAWVLSLGQPVTGLHLGMQFILQLDDGPGRVSICIENTFLLIEGCVVREINPENPATLGPALVVLHNTIEQIIAWKSDGRLCIEFEDGRRIVCYSHPEHESWQVRGPDVPTPLLIVGGSGGQLHVWNGQE